MLNDRLKSRSQRPAQITDGDVILQGSAPKTRITKSRHPNLDRAVALFALFVVLPSEADCAFLRARISAATARKNGARNTPQTVFDGLVGALETYAPWIVAGKLGGYGPRRGRFAAGFAHSIAPELDAYVAIASNERIAADSAKQALARTDPARQEIAGALQGLFGEGSDELARIKTRTADDTSRDGKLRAAGRFVAEIDAVRETVPHTMLEDAGITSEALDALATTADEAVDARAGYRRDRSARKVKRGDLSETVGRMEYELRQILAAAKRARKNDPSVPSFASPVAVTNARAKKAPAAPATPAAPAPAPKSPDA
jgi:hypothetical protein